MDVNASMCIFRESKQKAFEDACNAFRLTENMTEIAKDIGVSPTILRNKLNPEQPHVLTCVEMVAIAKATGNYTLVNCLLLGLGVVTAQIPEGATQETFIKRALENSIHSGDLSKLALEHAGNTRLTRSTKHTIINKAQQGISNLVLLISDLENRTSAATPIFSMGVDFIANGVSVPGLT